ncbi:NAD(P)-dependent alcohol dehydrogenase [Paradesertivirga mongoliensis]|uniref:NAD(P)-dependent alcohol dehydrogenase n=1 Tax=Paradesertivirga mongoliensis TaxID=2100740 RepID=A0ABW4ZRH2_9SPHI|nr:NAD(P)-dependent alcohol dehydrogenase [Pedobacter mongoliensis]
MKAYHLDLFNDVDGIVLHDHEMPVVKGNELLIRIKAVSLNRRDTYILDQTYPLPAKQGIIPVSDGAGEIVAIGQDVSRFEVGDKVIGCYFPRWRDGKMGYDVVDQLGCTMNGMLTEYAVLHEDSVVKFPAFLSWEEAATLPCAGLVAWSALMGPSAITPGCTILTIGSGGVSLFAIQFAKMVGATIISLTSSDSKMERLISLGATHVINYRTDTEWDETVLKITNNKGVDRVIETGGTDTLEKSIKATALGGEVVAVSPVGTLNDNQTNELKYFLHSLFVRLVTLKPLFVGSRLSLESMCRAIESNRVRPVIDKVFSFEEAKEAYRYFATGNQMGKVIIKGSIDQ